jgi:hypothetical protein
MHTINKTFNEAARDDDTTLQLHDYILVQICCGVDDRKASESVSTTHHFRRI